MSKTNLQSTTHGGGRVVSVILAGTLAFGMTPAVALTTQSLEPMQAFAAITLGTDTVDQTTLVYTLGTSETASQGNITLGETTKATAPTGSFKLVETDDTTAEVTGDYTVVYSSDKVTYYTQAELLSSAPAGTYHAYAKVTQDTTVAYSEPTETGFVISDATQQPTGKTNLETAWVTLSYNGAAISDSGFVIKVPSESTLRDEQTAYTNGVSVTVNGTELKSTDYSINFTTNATATGGTMTITGQGDKYENSYPAIPYTVEYEFGDDQVKLGANPTYNGLPQAPTITVEDPNTTVNTDPLKPTDYSVSYQLVNADGTTTELGTTKPTNAGSYNVVVTYNGAQGVKGFQIQKRAINDSTISITTPKPATYTGSTIPVPALTIKGIYGDALTPNTQTLVAGRDYEVVAPAGGMIDATPENSPYSLTINGLGNYSGTTTQPFVVNPAPFSSVNAVLTNADKLVFNGSETPAATFDVTFNGVKIESSKYEVSSTGTTTGKDVLVTLTPKADQLPNFTGTKQVKVNILKSIEGAQVVGGEIPDQTWGEGKWQKPDFALSYNGKELTAGTDYTVQYGENTSAGVDAGVITVTGIGEYSGTKVINYNIEGIEANITEVVVSDEAVFNGQVQDPAKFVTFKVTYTEDGVVKTLDPSKYTATVKTNAEFKDAQTYGLEISIAAGQYAATPDKSKTITIAQADLSTLKPKATQDPFLISFAKGTTTLTDAKPQFEVTLGGQPYTLDLTKDFTWADSSAVNLQQAGAYAVTINGAGNFKNSAPVKFNLAQDINTVYVTPIADVTYNGTAQTPAFTVWNSKANAEATTPNPDNKIPAASVDPDAPNDPSKVTTNYVVSWNDNINAGTAQLVLTGKGLYGGTKTVDFTIKKAAGTMTVAAVADQTYTGSAIQPQPAATITAGNATVASAFAYSYTNNVNAGTATVTVIPTGVGANYDVAPATVNFKINAANMSAVAYAGDTKVAVNKQPTIKLTYNGKELVAGTDYDVTETPVTSKAGKATLKVTGKGNFTGIKTIDITVEDASTPVNPDKPTTTEGWKHNSTGWWYETGEGSYVTSAWKKINGNWYYFNKSGYMMTGWQKINGTWYYLNKKGEGTEGAMVSNAWKKINGAWYSFDKNGAMRTGWYKENGIWYYLNKAGEGTEGKMVANQWKQINGSWFFFHSGGAMATSQYVGPYWVDANGYWVR